MNIFPEVKNANWKSCVFRSTKDKFEFLSNWYLEDSDYGKDKILFPTRAAFGGKKLKFLRIKLAGSLLDSGREKTCRKYHPFTKMSRKCISKALYRTFKQVSESIKLSKILLERWSICNWGFGLRSDFRHWAFRTEFRFKFGLWTQRRKLWRSL